MSSDLYMASLHNDAYETTTFCGGSLVHEQFVLTARHCTDLIKPLWVGVGTKADHPGSSGERIDIAAIFCSGDDTCEKKDLADLADIALLKLAKPATQGRPIAIVDAGAARPYEEGQTGLVVGWGSEEEDNLKSASELHEREAEVTSGSLCKETQAKQGYAGADLYCAGDAAKDFASVGCLYDSGDPLLITQRNRQLVAGVLSSNDPSNPLAGTCFQPGVPDTYTDVSANAGWIRETIEANAS